MAKAEIILGEGGGTTIEDIGNVLTTSGFTAGTKSTTSFTAIVGKTYMMVETRSNTYDDPGLSSGATEIGGTVIKNNNTGYNIYLGIVKATSTTVTGLGTNNYIGYCQLD